MAEAANSSERIYELSEIDRIIHEPARLIIMAHLYVVGSADFLFLMQQTGLTFGNLSSHMSKLEQAGFISVEKEFVDRKPHTMLNHQIRAQALKITGNECAVFLKTCLNKPEKLHKSSLLPAGCINFYSPSEPFFLVHLRRKQVFLTSNGWKPMKKPHIFEKYEKL